MKLKSPGKRAVRGLAVTGVALASVTGLVMSQAPAFADPGFTYVAVGSDTIQDFENAWTGNLTPGTLASYNATNPADNVSAHQVITPVKVGNSSANGGPTNALPAESCSFNRPNGSGDGNLALRGSLAGTPGMPATSSATLIPGQTVTSGTTTVTLPSNLPQQNCIDIGRSSSGLSSTNLDATAGTLIYIPFAVDGVTVSMGPSAAIAASSSTLPVGCSTATGATNPCVATPASNLIPTTGANAGVAPQFTFTQLQTMYKTGTAVTAANNGVTYFPYAPGATVPAGDVPVDLYVPQNGSGTLKFWSAQLGFTVGSTSPWIYQSIQADTGSTSIGGTGTVSSFVNQSVEEHDGTAVTVDPNGLFPFSIAQFIAQNNGHNPRFHGAQLLTVNSVAPETATKQLNIGFPNLLLREVYNVVAYDRVVNTNDGNFDPLLAGLLVSTSNTAPSLLCGQKGLISQYGFAQITTATSPAGLGGETGGHFCGQVDPTNERGYGATTGF